MESVKRFSFCNTAIIIINVLVFFSMEVIDSTENVEFMLRYGAMYWPYIIEKKEYYRLFTYMFLHFGISHIFNNMLVMVAIGDHVERALGKIKYLCLYFLSGILAGIVSIVYNMLKGELAVGAGASGAIFGLVGAMVYIVLINKGRVEDLTSRQLALFVFFSFYGGLTSQGIDNAAHIGGFLAGFLLAVLLYRKPVYREEFREL